MFCYCLGPPLIGTLHRFGLYADDSSIKSVYSLYSLYKSQENVSFPAKLPKEYKMQLPLLTCLLPLVLMLLTHVACRQDMMGPPVRPGVFRNPKELRNYLKSLNEYFAIVGRPRFGRSLTKPYQEEKRGFENLAGLDVDGDGVITNDDLSYYTQYLYGGR